MRLGIDVGGTNTDAVLMEGQMVLASAKSATTRDVSGGIVAAVSKLLRESRIAPEAVRQVMIGTTHFVNAFVKRKGLVAPMIVRIGLPAARGVPPTSGWPVDLRTMMSRHVVQAKGGFQFNGTEIDRLDEQAVAIAAREAKKNGISSAAISCIFSHLYDSMERKAREIFAHEAPDTMVTLSCEVGRMGMLERENAAIINASLAAMGREVVSAFKEAFSTLSIGAPLYVSQNDGTLMTANRAARFPVFTFASGPTNSMRGAAYLSRLKEAIVADIGGTTTDTGALVNGFPREAALACDFGGVRTNFRMPDVVSVGLGGGSIVRCTAGVTTVGPDSVGYRLTEEALVFGGQTLTATDISVAAGHAEIGDPKRVRKLSAQLVREALDAIDARFTDAVDRIKAEARELPLILVGGGAHLISRAVPGTSGMLIPDNAAVANAIGASIAQVSGEVDRVFHYADHGRDTALQEAKDEAARRAVAAGALAETVETVEVLELNLVSMPGNAVRVRVRAVGDLCGGTSQSGKP